ncbi:MAG UNVERIFIED_CONTAM: hypothetical protein LVR18_51140 [Planctomycetaceae bacterium]|jgi:SSS family solute:Na+ symporter
MQSPESLLSLLDYLVIAAYLAGTMILGLRIVHASAEVPISFSPRRQLPWWAIGMSLVATDIGGTDIIGAGGAAYRHGLAVANFEWIGCIPAMIIAAFVFIPWFYRAGVSTIPSFWNSATDFLSASFSPAAGCCSWPATSASCSLPPLA